MKVIQCMLNNAWHVCNIVVVCLFGFIHFEYSSKRDWISFKVHWSYGFGAGHEDGRSGSLSRSVADVVQQQWSPYSGRLRSSRNGGQNFSGRVGSENKKTLPRLDMFFSKLIVSIHFACSGIVHCRNGMFIELDKVKFVWFWSFWSRLSGELDTYYFCQDKLLWYGIILKYR